MQDEYDRIYQSKKRKQDDEDEYDAIYPSARKVAPPAPAAPEKPPLWDRIKDVGRAVAADPLGAAKSVGKGLVQNVGDAGSLLAAAGGNYTPLYDTIAEESFKGDGAEKRLMARGVGAASLMVPAARVGGAATSFLVNTAANAGLGAAQTPEDPMLGATLGAVIPAGISGASKLASRATGALSNRVGNALGDMRATAKGEAAIADMLGGLKSEVGPVVRRKGPQSTQSAIDALIDAGAVVPKSSGNPKSGIGRLTPDDVRAREVAKQRALDEMLIQEEVARVAATERISQGLADSRVTPSAPRGPAYDKPLPEGYLATADKPLPEVSVLPGQKPVIDPEVKASRVAGERLETAEQREAERLLTKEAKAIDKEAADEAAAAIADAEKAAKQAQKDTEKATKTLTQEKAKAAREAEKAALTADRAAQAAAKAAKLQADAAALEAAKAVGKDAVKEVRARQAAEKAAQRAADAQAKADFAAQAALDAQAKRALADEAAAKTVADMTPPSTETAAGMLNTANAAYNRTQRGKMAAQAALARRKPLNVAPVTPGQVEGAPVASVAPTAPLDAPAAPVAAPLTPSNAPAIPEVPPTATGPVDAPPVAPAVEPQAPLPPADKPFLNWRTLGVDPSKPDALNMSIAGRIQEQMRKPEFIEEMRAARGQTTFAAMDKAAQNSAIIRAMGVDPLSLDPKKVAGLAGEEIHALKPILRENVAIAAAISKEIREGNLSPDDLAMAQKKLDMLDEANANTLLVIQKEGSARGRDLGALRQVANTTLDADYWLVKAQRVLGDTPMSGDVQARILKLVQEAAEACGGA